MFRATYTKTETRLPAMRFERRSGSDTCYAILLHVIRFSFSLSLIWAHYDTKPLDYCSPMLSAAVIRDLQILVLHADKNVL